VGCAGDNINHGTPGGDGRRRQLSATATSWPHAGAQDRCHHGPSWGTTLWELAKGVAAVAAGGSYGIGLVDAGRTCLRTESLVTLQMIWLVPQHGYRHDQDRDYWCHWPDWHPSRG
jgi:hypothetical protein